MKTGDRLRAFRESLDPETGQSPLPRAALDRCCGASNRWEWLELLDDTQTHGGYVRDSVRSVTERLAISEEQAAEAMRFVLGERDTLPWSEPPKWRAGETPVKRMGRGRSKNRAPAGEIVPMPPRGFEVQLLALLRARDEGEIDDSEIVVSLYNLPRIYYNKTERSGDAVA